MTAAMLTAATRETLDVLHADLRQVFGPRLITLVAYGPAVQPRLDGIPREIAAGERPLHTLALVDRVGFGDLDACARRARQWGRRGLATPLLLTRDEFTRSLDVFPLEYGDIMARHVVVTGESPFAGLGVRSEDVRRACEVQAKSHLIHLREGYLDAAGHGPDLARVIVASAAPFASLLASIARLQGDPATTAQELAESVQAGLGVPAALVQRIVSLRRDADLSGAAALELFPSYLDAVERLWRFVDGWGIERRPA